MYIEQKKIKFTKTLLVFIASMVFLFSLYNLFQGSKLIGKTFSGFGIGVTIIFSPTSDKNWTGYQKDLETYNKIIKIDNTKIYNAEHFKSIIESKAPDTNVEYTFIKDNKVNKTSIKTMLFSNKIFLQTYGLTFLISLFYFFISLFIISNYKPNDSKIKCLLIFTLLFTASCENFYDMSFTHKFVSIGYLIEVFTVASLVQLGLYINEKNINTKLFKSFVFTNIFLSTLISYTQIISYPFIVNDIYENTAISDMYMSNFLILVNYIALCFLSFIILACYAYFKSSLNGLEKTQNRIIFTGTLLSFSPYFVLWFLPTLFRYQASLQYVFICFIIFPISITYSIIRYKAFDIEFFIRKGLIYVVLSLLLGLGYFILSTLAFMFLKNYLSLNQEVYIAVSAILATLITGQLRDVIQNTIDRAFYRHKLDLSVMLQEFLNEVNNVFDKKDLLKTSIFYLEKTINPLFVGLYLPDQNNHKLQLLGANNNVLPQDVKFNNETWLDINKKFQSNEFNGELLNIDKSLVVPLKNDNNTIGILVLGEKKSEIEYLFEEKNFLKNFTSSLSMALKSLLLKEETISLVLKNMELEGKASFLRQLTANLSHDLKFPLSSAYSIVERIKYVMEKKNIKNDYIDKNMSDLTKSLKKLGEHISISLDRELINLGKLVLKLEEVSVKQICNDAIFLHSDNLEKNDITLNYHSPECDVFILGDSIRLENVISNLISNAIKYGGDIIELNLEIIDNNVLICFSDNGEGIDEQFKNKIFDCYSKVDSSSINSGKERSTGLGLFICKNYIELMNGNISFESEKNKGTRFFIKLPLLEISIDDTSIQSKITELK